MSGAEALFGVGILCNSMQIVTFARDALQVARHINEGGSPDPKLRQYVRDAELEYQRLSNKVAQLSLSDDDKKLVQTGTDCTERLKTLSKRLEGLSLKRDSEGIRKFALSVKQGAKTLWSAQELKDYERDFERYDSLLKTELILRIANEQDAAMVQQAEAYQKLDARVKDFVNSHLPSVMKSLVENDGIVTRQHITETDEHTQELLSNHRIQSQETQHYERILDSLRYPMMNDRKNTVKDNHPETFKWVFEKQKETNVPPNSNETPERYDIRKSSTSTSSESRGALAFWLETDSPIFWISGQAASGKSTLMRYIMQSPQTKLHLDQDHRNTLIVSHYFWKPGNTSQRTLKGMMATLLFQILKYERALLMCLDQHVGALDLKHSFSDWHTADIRTGLLACLKAFQSPICIFLDGLDEAEDPVSLLDKADRGTSLLDDILNTKGIKVCISSRSEPELQHYLGHCPKILLQDLTKSDMHSLAKSRLSNVNIWPTGFRENLIATLLDKAGGVFLWLVLVVESLNRGIRLREHHDTLRKRLGQMPDQLESLIRDMFARQGEDARLYRLSASLLFKISIVYSNFPKIPIHIHKSTLLRLPLVAMVADKDFIDACIREGPQYATGPRVLRLMEKCERDINVHCAGLLDIGSPVNLSRELQTPLANDGGHSIFAAVTAQLRYIHRSVYDFLTDATEGRELVNACQVSDDEIRIRFVIGMLALENVPLRRPVLTSRDTVGTLDLFYATSLESALDVISKPFDSETSTNHLLKKAWEWHTAGKLRVSRRWCSPLANQYLCGQVLDKPFLALDFFYALLRSRNYQHASEMLSSIGENELPVAIHLVLAQWPLSDANLMAKALERLHGSSTIAEQMTTDALSFLLLNLVVDQELCDPQEEISRFKRALALIEKYWPMPRNRDKYNLPLLVEVSVRYYDRLEEKQLSTQIPTIMVIGVQLGFIMRWVCYVYGYSMLNDHEVLPDCLDEIKIAVAHEDGVTCRWRPGKGVQFSVGVDEGDPPISTRHRRLLEERMEHGLLSIQRHFSSSPPRESEFIFVAAPVYRDFGKDLALEYLHQHGFEIHPWNYRPSPGGNESGSGGSEQTSCK